jgi:hypothetical protein
MNKLLLGDNLEILKTLKSESVDLIYKILTTSETKTKWII